LFYQLYVINQELNNYSKIVTNVRLSSFSLLFYKYLIKATISLIQYKDFQKTGKRFCLDEKGEMLMKVKIGKWNVHFLWIFGVSLVLLLVAIFVLLYKFHISHVNILFGAFAILLLIVLAYYWMNSKGYHNNLGRIRRTFYTMYLLLMAIGVITGKVDLKDWKHLTEITALVVFVDLAIFQCPNILKIWSAEFKHDDEVREALDDSKKMILKSAKKVEKFSQIIQYTDVHFENRMVPVSMEEYQQQLAEYIKLYSSTFGISISYFLFDSPTDEAQKKGNIEAQIENISMRHAVTIGEEKAKWLESFSNGETVIVKEEKLIAIPYFGDYYSMILTLEANGVAVDGIDASHVSNMLNIFDWYMTDGGEEVEDE
jgi:hypothetical protein